MDYEEAKEKVDDMFHEDGEELNLMLNRIRRPVAERIMQKDLSYLDKKSLTLFEDTLATFTKALILQHCEYTHDPAIAKAIKEKLRDEIKAMQTSQIDPGIESGEETNHHLIGSRLTDHIIETLETRIARLTKNTSLYPRKSHSSINHHSRGRFEL